MYKDEFFMQRAIDIAYLSHGNNAPNPMVGAVIVYNNQIIGEGFHAKYGEAHAEVNAFADVSDENTMYLPQSTIYITLEPCHHYGKTPPCVDLILKKGCKRVVIACKDPFEKVAGKSIQKLKENDVEVTVGCLEEQGRELAKRFFTNVSKKRPFIRLKFAQSKDGFIGAKDKQVSISNAWAKRMVHKWRCYDMAILVGTNTALIDNPSLTNRYFVGRSPIRFFIDKDLKVPDTYHLYDGSVMTYVFTAEGNTPSSKNVTPLHIDFTTEVVPQIIQHWNSLSIQSVMVEGGAYTLQQFIDQSFWDEMNIFQSEIYLKEGMKGPLITGLPSKHEQIEDNSLYTFMNPAAKHLS